MCIEEGCTKRRWKHGGTMFQQIDITTLPVAHELDWRIEFGLWLRNTPSQKRRERDLKTIEAYECDIKLMAGWFEMRYGIEFDPSHMNAVNLKEYFAQYETKPATHKRKLASVRMLVKWSLLAKILDCDPTDSIPFVNATPQAPRDVTIEEQARLEAIADSLEGLIGLRDRLIFHLMLDAGLRISETVELKLTDIEDMEHGKIHVYGKGKKNRWPHINNALVELIRLWLDRKPDSVEGTLITSEQGTAIGREEAWRRFEIIRNAANVECTPHSMRHQFVMNYMAAYMRGDPSRFPAALKATSQETGDDPKVILEYYTGPRESDMRAAVEAM